MAREIESDWTELLLTWLNDPPDKALCIAGHVPQVRDHAKFAIDEKMRRMVLEDTVSVSDPPASMIERLPMPTTTATQQETIKPQWLTGELK